MKYTNVSCSSCGQDFGPGDNGFSYCKSHSHLKPVDIDYRHVMKVDDASGLDMLGEQGRIERDQYRKEI
jgi:hypothetical protein